jgi:SAM-dependent methyltransferase
MLDIIDSLPPGARVLDLGARLGSFSTTRNDICVVRLDLDAPAGAGALVRGDAARLPFKARCFDLIVSNHSLEHFVELEATVREIGRVVKEDGVLYVAVPDAGTLTDRIYRWLGKGGGHVNAFRQPSDVIGLLERWTPLAHRSTTLLYSSLAFLNAHNQVGRPQRKLALFGFGNECFLAWLVWVLRGLDRVMGTRWSVYGWSFRFGNVAPETHAPWCNVCVRCGSGAAGDFLRSSGAVSRGRGGMERYHCPNCGAANLFIPDFTCATPG